MFGFEHKYENRVIQEANSITSLPARPAFKKMETKINKICKYPSLQFLNMKEDMKKEDAG